MLKLALWVGVPSFITYLVSSYTFFLENVAYIFALSVVALVVAIVPRLSDRH